MPENIEVPCRRNSISHGGLGTGIVCVVHKVHQVTVISFGLLAYGVDHNFCPHASRLKQLLILVQQAKAQACNV